MNIKSYFCQNPKTVPLHNSQVGAVVMVCTLAYKLSSLPSLVSEGLSSSTMWFFLGVGILDALSFCLLYAFFYDGGDSILSNSVFYKIGLVFVAVFLGFKCLVFFSLSVLFFTVELYVGVSPIIVVSILIAPVIYVGAKGVNTIARICEIMVFLIFGIVILNLAFLDADLEIGRNLPVFSVPVKEFFAQSFRYGTWLGNFFPLMFVKVQNKKFPYVATSFSLTQIVILIVVFIGVAMYGNALKIVGNLLIEMAGFNQLSTEIGRMEWTALFAVIIMGVVELAFLFSGVCECSLRLVKSRAVLGGLLATLVFLLCVLLNSPQTIADFSQNKIVGYIMSGLSLVLPAYFLALKMHTLKKGKQNHLTTSTCEKINEKLCENHGENQKKESL